MLIAPQIKESMSSSSFIRKMFEEGIQLKAQFGSDAVFDFSIGNPDLDPPAKVHTILKNIANSTEKGMHAYMPNAGYKETREAMAQKVSLEQETTVDFSHVIMSVGAAGAINSVLKAIVSFGDEIVVPAPFFAEYTHYAKNHGGILKPVSTKENFSLDLRAISASITEKTCALILNSPNNPTGKIYSSEEIAELAEVLRHHTEKTGRTIVIIADEPYREIVYDNKKVAPIFPLWPATIIVSSFAKNLSLPGERIGYAVVNPSCPDAKELIDAIIFSTRVLGFVNAPAVFQRVVAQCWNEKVDYSLYSNRRNTFMSILTKAEIEFAIPEGAFYLFCKVPAPANSKHTAGSDAEFCEHLKKFKILGVPGTGFGKKGWFRLAYCVSEDSITRSSSAFIAARAQW